MAERDEQHEPPPAPVDDDGDGGGEGDHQGDGGAGERSGRRRPASPPLATPKDKDAELEQLQKTHDEYVRSSCEYERELESELERCEKKALALELSARASEAAREQLGGKLGEAQAQLEAAKLRERAALLELEEMKWKVQRLEQANDELETAARIAQASVADLEHANETLLEQTVFLAQEKEEVARQLAAITVAEVHPLGSGSSTLTLASGSSLLKATASARSTASQQPQHTQQARGKPKTRYPDVVESCIHITCQKCRAGSGRSRSPHRHLGPQPKPPRRSSSSAAAAFEGAESAKKRAAPSSVFERMRLRFRSLFNCADDKQAAAASAPKS